LSSFFQKKLRHDKKVLQIRDGADIISYICPCINAPNHASFSESYVATGGSGRYGELQGAMKGEI